MNNLYYLLILLVALNGFGHRTLAVPLLDSNAEPNPHRRRPGQHNFFSHQISPRSSYSGPPWWDIWPITDPATSQPACAISRGTINCCGTPAVRTWKACPWTCTEGVVSSVVNGSNYYVPAAPVECNDYNNGVAPGKESYEVKMVLVSWDENSCTVGGAAWTYTEPPRTNGGSINSQCSIVGAPCNWDRIAQLASGQGNRTISFIPGGSYQPPASPGYEQTFSSHGNLTLHYKISEYDAYYKDSALCSMMVMGCPVEKQSVYSGGSYADPIGFRWHCLPLPGLGKNRGYLVKTTGRNNETACLTSVPGGSSCLELERTCCELWTSYGYDKPYPFSLTAPVVFCNGIPEHELPDHWCSLARKLLANTTIAPDYDHPLGDKPDWSYGNPNAIFSPDGVRLLGDNCTFNDSAANREANPTLVDQGAGPWVYDSSMILRRTSDGRIACLAYDYIDQYRVKFACWTADNQPLCAQNLAQSANNDARSLVLDKVYLKGDPANLDGPAKAANATLGPWTCVRECPGASSTNAETTYIRIRRYGSGALAPLVDYSKNFTYQYIDASCRQDKSYLSTTGFCNNSTCPQWLTALDTNSPALLCPNSTNTTYCKASGWSCIRSAADKGNYILSRLLCSGEIQCLGPNDKSCSWFNSNLCTTLAKGEPEPEASNVVGMVCDGKEGWCGVVWRTLTRNGEVERPGCCDPSATTTTVGVRPTASTGALVTGTTMATEKPSLASKKRSHLGLRVALIMAALFGLYC